MPCKEHCQILYGDRKGARQIAEVSFCKKGADRCIYHLGGSRQPLTDKHKRPTPRKGRQNRRHDLLHTHGVRNTFLQPAEIRPKEPLLAVRQTHLRERSLCPRLFEICTFHMENKSKTLLYVIVKNNLFWGFCAKRLIVAQKNWEQSRLI